MSERALLAGRVMDASIISRLADSPEYSAERRWIARLRGNDDERKTRWV